MNNHEHDQKAESPHSRSTPLTASDLPIDDQGRIYHLQITPEQLAPDILIVGDPGRAEMIGSTFLHDTEVEHEHRGLVTVTGTYGVTGKQATMISPLRTSVTTSGMGTPSLEIVLQELVALNEIDFKTRTPKTAYPRLQIIRVGTSGGLQASTQLGTPIISSYSIGLDNTGLFYEIPYPDEISQRLEKEIAQLSKELMPQDSRFYGRLFPYISRANPIIVNALMEASETLGVVSKVGLSVSGSGFFASQGRDITRVKPSIPDLDKILAEYDPKLGGQRIENMEMESSFLSHFMGGLGYWAGAICITIANRRQDTFYTRYQEAVENSIRVALMALAMVRSRFPDAKRV